MSKCSICNKNQTRMRPLLTNTNICVECTDNINNQNCIITSTDENSSVNDISDISSINQIAIRKTR